MSSEQQAYERTLVGRMERLKATCRELIRMVLGRD